MIKKISILILIFALFLLNGCGRKTMLNRVSDTLSGGGNASFIMNDDDPEFVAAALPLALKMYEGLIEANPRHVGLRSAAAMGFASYAYAFLHYNADTTSDPIMRRHLFTRARNMYIRARDYGLSALELRHPNFRAELAKNPEATLAAVGIRDIDLLYWTGIAWMGAFTSDRSNFRLALTVPQAKALLFRVAELNPDYGNGALDEFFITLFGTMPASMGGDPEKARYHFERAVKLSENQSISAYINYVMAISVSNQNGAEFDSLLNIAAQIRVDDIPEMRLLRVLQNRRVRHLRENRDLFIRPIVIQKEEEISSGILED
ncbi:MAG: TRAP transporter TatT component family protein [Chitinivibrionia bacterium]|nr:TRAP transporter TatT component family protein [Chitinivibrionia bacterium]